MQTNIALFHFCHFTNRYQENHVYQKLYIKQCK